MKIYKKGINLNLAQMSAIQANEHGRKNIYLEWGRGAGKSTVLAWFMRKAVDQMPRATGILVGETFTQVVTRTLPSTKEGLELFGLYEDVHFVVGRSGKSLGFEMPFQAPNRWYNAIHFYNGFVWLMVSLDQKDGGRGINSYVVIGDEAALLNQERLFNNVQTTNRAIKADFKECSLLNAEIYASSTPLTMEGRWFTDIEKEAVNDKSIAFIKANAYINKANLEPNWFNRMKRNAVSKIHYEAEILNIRPRSVRDGFYPKLNHKIHYYQNVLSESDVESLSNRFSNYDADVDVVRNLPLHVSMDFGGRINSMLVRQHIKSTNEVRYLKNLFVKNPKIIQELVQDFCDYYEDHPTKIVYLIHDKEGFKALGNSKTNYADDAIAIFKKNGWKTINNTLRANNPDHSDKFRVINNILAETNPRTPRVRINKYNCQELIISLENAEIKQKGLGFEKNKSSERSTIIPQEHATHLSDCFDYDLYWSFRQLASETNKESFFIEL
jgi:hypothetical protein